MQRETTSEAAEASAHSASGRARIDGWRWGIVWLMFLATMINYMDRQTLGSASQWIMRDFDLNEAGYGWIEFWFGIAFGLAMFPAGIVANRVNLRWLYALALLVWSAAGFCTGLANSITALYACRVLLGLGEAFNWPCAVAIVRRIIPLESRSLANGLFHSGASIGAVVTPLMYMAIVGPDGENWRLLFQFVGAAGLIWAVLWFAIVRGPKAEIVSLPGEVEPTSFGDDLRALWQLSSRRTFWITLIVSLAVNGTWHFYRIWLPRVCKAELELDPRQVQWALIGFFVCADLGCMAAGWLTRRLTHTGYSVERSRKIVMTITAVVCLAATPAALVMTPAVSLPLLYIVAAGAMGGFPNFFALSQEVSPRHTAICLGFFASLAWLAIACLAPVVGAIVDRIGTFGPPLIVMGFVPLLGAAAGWFWPEEEGTGNRTQATGQKTGRD